MSKNEPLPQSLHVVAQYLKDLSFENPGQGSLSCSLGGSPEININIQIDTQKDPQDIYKNYVDIVFKAISSIKGNPLFILDVVYTGVFEIKGFDPALEEQIKNIQCPALLFPFLRRIISDKTLEGGYPPLLLDPIDFHAIYMQSHSDKQKASEQISEQTEEQPLKKTSKKNIIN